MDNPIPYDAYQITQTVMVANFNAHKDGEQHSPWQKNLYEKGYTISINSSKIDSGGLSLGGKIKNPLPTPLKRKRMIADKISPKDYIDARQNAYEKSVDGRISVYEKSIDERIVRIEKSNDDLRKEINAFAQEIKKDNSSTRRAVWSSLIGGAITLGGIFVTSFFAIPSVMDFGSKIKDVVNIEVTKQNAETNKRFVGIETRMDGLDNRMNGLEKRMDSVETKLDKLIEIATDKQ